jgi:hypothetical protein
VVARLDAAIGSVKIRDRGVTGGQVLVGMAAVQLAGEDFLVGLDCRRAGVAGQMLTAVPGLARVAQSARPVRPEEGVVVERR